MQFTINQFKKVKLLIWDLDDTFWKGTLSDHTEEGIHAIPENIELVKTLTYRGIVQSVCSKNNEADALQELEKLGVKDFFVFNSISWEPKGMRLKDIIAEMALRPENVLFVDDNPSNLAEAEQAVPGLMVSLPSILPELLAQAETVGKDDSSLSRLKQYKVLETKREKKNNFPSNEAFLKASNIQLRICTDVLPSAARLFELMLRSNQLNFTKRRDTEDEFRALLEDDSVQKGYVEVSDAYGQYGIVGFYAVKDHVLLHFFFSCRTMGMGIEQYVYSYLNYPSLQVVNPVSGSVSKEAGMPNYIHLITGDSPVVENYVRKSNLRLLLKGPCDLQVVASYLEAAKGDIDTEFNYIDENGNQADYYNHSINILSSLNHSAECSTEKFSFLSASAQKTSLFSTQYDVICLSPLMDATLGVYRNKTTGEKLAYGLYSYPITDENNWDAYIGKQVMTARSNFTREELQAFSATYEHVEYSPEQIAENYCTIIRKVQEKNPEVHVVLFTLSELPFSGKNSDVLPRDKDTLHRKINAALRARLEGIQNIYILDVNQYIKTPEDYFDNINHYSKLVYYHIAQDLLEYISLLDDSAVSIQSAFAAKFQHIKREIYKKIFLK